MDLQLIGDLFGRCIKASEILDVDKEFRDQLKVIRQRLPPLQIGKQGQLQEWIYDMDIEAPDRGHRHLSHLYAMMPGQSITPQETPRFASAVRKSLELRGDGGMGWSKAWKVGLWARLGEGDRALSMVEGLIRESTLPSLLDNGPPFQIDGNFGGCAGIGEMLLQSRAAGEATLDDTTGKLRERSGNDTTIELLPALPGAWPTGKVSGLCARGGFEVDCRWRDGRLTEATIHSKRGGSCRICYRDKMISLNTRAGQSYHLNNDLKYKN
jgi:alpha-L-fucosidase 2